MQAFVLLYHAFIYIRHTLSLIAVWGSSWMYLYLYLDSAYLYLYLPSKNNLSLYLYLYLPIEKSLYLYLQFFFCICPNPVDHSALKISFRIYLPKKGPGYWKLNDSVLNDKQYLDEIRKVIGKTSLEYQDLKSYQLIFNIN